MASAENAKLEIEAGQVLTSMVALTDSGDHLTYESGADFWSNKRGFAPVVRPNGLRTGGVITGTGVNNEVQTSAMSVNLNGVVTSVAADTSVSITRTAGGGAFQINSITVNSSGAVVAVAGTEGSAFTETRAAAGGPPLIPTTSVEIGQVRTTSNTDAAIDDDEIFQVVGTHTERADYPLFDTNYLGGSVTAVAELPLIHTGPVTKSVYAEYYEPVFTRVLRANNVVPPENSWSVTSEQTYDGVSGSVSKTLNQGSFEARIETGISDTLVRSKDTNLWFKFFPDRYQDSYIAFQGYLGIARQFPADGAMRVSCTVSSEAESTDVEV